MENKLTFNKFATMMFFLTIILPFVTIFILLDNKKTSLKQQFMRGENVYCCVDDYKYIVINKNSKWVINGDYFENDSMSFKILDCSFK